MHRPRKRVYWACQQRTGMGKLTKALGLSETKAFPENAEPHRKTVTSDDIPRHLYGYFTHALQTH